MTPEAACSPETAIADEEAVNVVELTTNDPSRKGVVRIQRVRRGTRAWHVKREPSGTRETRCAPLLSGGRPNKEKRGRLEGAEGVGHIHSTHENGRAVCMGKGCASSGSVYQEQRSAARVMPAKRANIIAR